MTPFARLLRNAAQRIAGVYYEGEQPPERLAKLVDDFAAWYPKATPEQWRDFAKSLVAACYKEGYVRGYERSERVPGDALPGHPPELVADMVDPGWWKNPMMGPEGEGIVIEQEIEPGEIVPKEDEKLPW